MSSSADGRKVVDHPVAVCRLVFEHVVFNPQSDHEQRMILYTPLPEGGTAYKLVRLLGG